MLLTVGEALMEFRRSTPDGSLVLPGQWDGPFPSGAPAIFASVAARLGAPVALAAAVGADRFGDALIQRLDRDGVRTGAIERLGGRATATAFVAYRGSGDRDFWYSVHDSAAMAVDLASVECAARDADWLHVSGSTVAFGGPLADAVEAAAAIVLRAGGRMSIDPNLRPDAPHAARERTVGLVRRAHVLFPSEGELSALGLAEQDVLTGDVLVCTTRGKEGVVLSGPDPSGGAIAIAPPAVDEVDPTGAGDTFAATFVTALRAGIDPETAAGRACETAAWSVGVLGAMEAPVGEH